MSEREHTPTPWEVVAGDDYMICAPGYPLNPSPVVDNNLTDFPDDVLLAIVGNQTADCGEANAYFVVRAVNNHEALVEALSGLGWHSQNGIDVCWCHVKSDGYAKHTEPCKAARAALALAQKRDLDHEGL